nr:unnamed protein product [Naegleria fowleri]
MGGGSEFPTNNHASNYFQQHPSQQHPLSIPQFHQPYYSSPPFPSFQNNLHLFNQPPWNTTNSPSIRSVDNFSSLPSASPSLPASSSNDSSCFYSIPSIDNDQSHPPFHPRSNVVLNQLFHNNEHQDFYNPSRENSFMSTSDSSLVLPESSLSSSTQVQPLHGTLPKEEKKIPTSSTNDDHNLLIHFYGNDEPIIFIKKIGQGGFGSVYHVRTQAQKAMRNNYNHLQYKEEEEEHREFALKVLKDQNVSLNEIKRRFEHEHILPMRAKKPPLTIEVEKINNQFPGQVSVLCIESPYMRLGSLQQKCKELSEKTLWLILQQISSALAYMYTIDKCLHRDVKPENILIKEYDESTGDIHVVLGDFGLVRSEDTISSSNKSGTPSYASPEREYSNDSDIFALGVTMFKLITGFSKIDDKTFSEHYQTKNDLSEEIKRQIGNRVSKSMIDMIIQLTRKKRPRISYQEIQEICRNNLLRHEK